MWPFKKKIKPLNASILREYRAQGYGRLENYRIMTGTFETRIDGITYKAFVKRYACEEKMEDDFVRAAILDRVRLIKYAEKHRATLDKLRYGGYRYIKDDGTAVYHHD